MEATGYPKNGQQHKFMCVSVHRNWLRKRRTKDEKKKRKTKRILISDVIRCTQPKEERRQLQGIRGWTADARPSVHVQRLKTKTKQPTPYNNDYEPLTLNGKENAGLQISATKGVGLHKKGWGKS